MGIRENRVETLLKSEIKALGGISYKWTGMPGVPDQIVIVRHRVWMVEVKTADGRLSPMQQRRHRELTDHGAQVRTVYGDTGVHEFIEEVKNVIATATTA